MEVHQFPCNLTDPVVTLCLVHKSEKDVSDRLPNVRAVVHEFPVNPMKDGFQVVSLPWVLTENVGKTRAGKNTTSGKMNDSEVSKFHANNKRDLNDSHVGIACFYSVSLPTADDIFWRSNRLNQTVATHDSLSMCSGCAEYF